MEIEYLDASPSCGIYRDVANHVNFSVPQYSHLENGDN